MIIVSSFKLYHNESLGIFTITPKENICYPLCNGELIYRDSRPRKLKNLLGEVWNFFYIVCVVKYAKSFTLIFHLSYSHISIMIQMQSSPSLRSMKTAALMLGDDSTEPLTEGVNHIALLAAYFDNPTKFLDADYRYAYIVSNDIHWVGYRLNRRGGEGQDVRNRLVSIAKNLGICGSFNTGVPPVSNDEAHVYHGRDNVVWMPVP